MNDIETRHVESSRDILRKFHEDIASLLMEAAKNHENIVAALSLRHAQLSEAFGELGRATEAEIDARITATRAKHEELLALFNGRPPMPKTSQLGAEQREAA